MRIQPVLFCVLVAVLCGTVQPDRQMIRRWKRAITSTTTINPWITTVSPTSTTWLPWYLRTTKRPSTERTSTVSWYRRKTLPTSTPYPGYERTTRKTTTPHPGYERTTRKTTTANPWYDRTTQTVPWYERTMSPKSTTPKSPTTQTWWNRYHKDQSTTQSYWNRYQRRTTKSYWNPYETTTNFWDRYETTTDFWERYINARRTTNMWDRWEENGPTTSYWDLIDALKTDTTINYPTFETDNFNFEDQTISYPTFDSDYSTDDSYSYTGTYVGVPTGIIFVIAILVTALRLCLCHRRITRTVTIVRRPATISVLSVTALANQGPPQDDQTSLINPKDQSPSQC